MKMFWRRPGVVFVAFLLWQLIVSVYSLQKRCSQSASGDLLIEIKEQESTSAQQILAYGPNYEQGCKSSVTPVTNGQATVNVLSLVIEYNYTTGDQLSPAVDDCYVQQGQTATEYEVTVVVQELIGAIQVTDKFYSVVCDTDNLDTGYIDVNAVDVALNNVSPTPAADQQETFNIQLVDNSNVPLTEVELGDPVHILMTYTKPTTAVGEWPIGVHNYLLTVHYNRSEPSGEVTLIDENGCSTYGSDVNASPFELIDSFVWIGTGGGAGNEYYFRTGEFKIAMLEGGNQLMFRGYYRAECYSTSESKCFNQDAYCNSLGRRKRSVEPEVNGTYDLSVTIRPPGFTTSIGTNSSTSECDPDIFWIVAIVLGVLLLLVTVTSLFLIHKLCMERRRTNKLLGKS